MYNHYLDAADFELTSAEIKNQSLKSLGFIQEHIFFILFPLEKAFSYIRIGKKDGKNASNSNLGQIALTNTRTKIPAEILLKETQNQDHDDWKTRKKT